MSGVTHGGLQAAELEALGLDAADVLDLSMNVNPLGPHPDVLIAASEADVRRYPDPDARQLREALASAAGLEPDQVLVTAGATAALHLVSRALLAPGEECALFTPTFGEYEAAVQAAGGRVVEYRAEPPAFTPVSDPRPAPLGILCNPNNPTGVYLERAQVEALAARLGGTLVLDVAYDPFVLDPWDADALVRDGAQVIVVHSMTKLHAMPGLRIGYITGPAPLLEQVARFRPSWSVGAPALAAALAALSVEPAQRRAAPEVARVRGLLTEAFRKAGLEVADGQANFLLVHVGNAEGFRRRLLPRGFAVRDCTSFGLPEWVRVAVPMEAAARRLATAVRAILAEAGD